MRKPFLKIISENKNIKWKRVLRIKKYFQNLLRLEKEYAKIKSMAYCIKRREENVRLQLENRFDSRCA